jgi:hypothetical protein
MTPAFDRDLLALYVLGALEPAEAAPIEAALAAGDAETIAAVAEARRLAAAIGASAVEVAPPAGARDRLLARVRREGGGAPAVASRAAPGGTVSPRPRPRWMAPAAITAVFMLLAVFSVLSTLNESRIDKYVATVAEVAGDPDAVRWTLASAAPDGGKVGVVYHQPKSGRLLVLGKALPKAPDGKTYVLWTIPPGGGAPVNRGAMSASILGGAATLLLNAPAPAEIDTVAVSLESDPRTPTPTAVQAFAKGGS